MNLNQFDAPYWARVLRHVCFALGLTVLPAAMAGEETQPNPATVLKQTCDLIQRGRFAEAGQTLHPILGNAAAPVADNLAQWLKQRQDQAAAREERREKEYQKYVTWAKEMMATGKIREALIEAANAYLNSNNQTDFCRQDWVRQLAEVAVAKAEAFAKEQKWLRARNLYLELQTVFEHDPIHKEYEQKAKECQLHVRLEAMYKPDGEWRDALRGIEASAVEDALWRIEKGYFEVPDFAKMTREGLKSLMLLAESDTLAKVLPALGNAGLRMEFTSRLQARYNQVGEDKEFGRRDAKKEFNNVLTINRQTLALPEELVISEFFQGALDPLDKFTSVIWPSELSEFEKHTRGEFVGVGIQIAQVAEQIQVVSPLPDTPAYVAGIQADDLIIKIDGVTTKGMSLNKAVDTITGPIGTMVTLTIRRPGVADDIDFKLRRAIVEIKTVRGVRRDQDQHWDYIIDPNLNIGYVRVDSFMDKTVEDLKEVLESLERQDVRGLILDLRGNPGGLLRSAVDMADLFLSSNQIIVKTNGRNSAPWQVSARSRGMFADLPMIVLVNESSASASEIVAGAVKDHRRALIVGARTYGKGSVQNLIEVGANTHIKLTTALYYLPNGECLHRQDDAASWGVEPDVVVELAPKEIRKIYEMRRKADIIRFDSQAKADDGTAAPGDGSKEDKQRPADGGEGIGPPSPDDDEKLADSADEEDAGEDDKLDLPDDPNDWPDADAQLDTALLIMRAMLACDHNSASMHTKLTELDSRNKTK